MNRIRFDFEVTECGPVPDLGPHDFDNVEILTTIQGDFHLQIGEYLETFDKTPLLMISTGLVDATWLTLTFRSLKSSRTVTIPDHDPVIDIAVTPEESLSISLVTGRRVLAQSPCDALVFLRQVGAFHEAVFGLLLKVNPHLLENTSFLRCYPGAFHLAHGV